MLPSRNRIRRKDFPAYKNQGSRFFSPLFSAVFYNDSIVKNKESKACVVVSKKTEKRAVGRNKMKRQFYGLLGKFLKPSVGLSATKVIIYPKKEAQNTNFNELKNEMESLFKQIRIKNKEIL